MLPEQQQRVMSGSSPPTRGSLPGRHEHVECVRFIPAYTGVVGTFDKLDGSSPPTRDGDHDGRSVIVGDMYGSSPPIRGSLPAVRAVDANVRFIPAYTGITCSGSAASRPCAVHPRLHGDHGVDGDEVRTARRFIPAYTGITACTPHPRPAAAVHPRLHGDHAVSAGERVPPHRFIPAYTGITRDDRPASRPLAVHPRLHGDHVGRPCAARALPVHPRLHGDHETVDGKGERIDGSSPPTRGSRRVCPLSEPISAVHPRLHGDHVSEARSSRPTDTVHPRLHGSSPPTRFIPAYTGITSSWRSWSGSSSVHPRLHGDHTLSPLRWAELIGSSPPTRGSHEDGPTKFAAWRFIPAYTGITCSGSGRP